MCALWPGERLGLELIDFTAAGTTSQAVADFHPSGEAQQRVADLLEREQTTGLTAEECIELTITWSWNTS